MEAETDRCACTPMEDEPVDTPIDLRDASMTPTTGARGAEPDTFAGCKDALAAAEEVTVDGCALEECERFGGL